MSARKYTVFFEPGTLPMFEAYIEDDESVPYSYVADSLVKAKKYWKTKFDIFVKIENDRVLSLREKDL